MIGVLCSPIIIVASIPTKSWISLEVLTTFASWTSLAMLVYAADVLYIFDKTWFYFWTICETIYKIRAFMLVMFLFLLLFGVPMSLLDMNRAEEEKTIGENFPHWLPNLLINQYLLALGTFDDSPYSGASDAWILYIIFFCATIVIFIVMTNQLITIVGNILDEFSDGKRNEDLKLDVGIMFDCYLYSKVPISLHLGKIERDERCFLYLVTPEENDEDVEETLAQNGVLGQLKNYSDQRFSKLEAQFVELKAKMKSTIEEKTD